MAAGAVSDADFPTVSLDTDVKATMPLSAARAIFTTLVNQAADDGQRVVITKFGRPAAAIVPIYDLKRLLDADAQARDAMNVDDSHESDLVEVVDDRAEEHRLNDFIQIVDQLLELDIVQERLLQRGYREQLPSTIDNNKTHAAADAVRAADDASLSQAQDRAV